MYEGVHVTLMVGEFSDHNIIYCLDPTKKRKVKSFFAEFAILIYQLSSISHGVIITYDYNIHWDKSTKTETKHLVELLHSSSTIQSVKERTHTSCHIINLVVSYSNT